MDLNKRNTVRIMKRLAEAVGYLELGMPRQATACLDRLGDARPFAPIVDILRGEAARLDNRFVDAAKLFENAAQTLPAPFDRPIWLALSKFYQKGGATKEAIDSLARARGAYPRQPSPEKKR